MNKSVIKKVKHALKISTIALLTATTIASSLIGCSSHQKADSTSFTSTEYASDEQINQLAEDLNCDTSYLLPHKYKLTHNNGQPIYVTFSEEYTDHYKAIVTESLNNIFSLLNKVNNLYHYEIVNDYDSISSYSNIRYEIGVNNNIDGLANVKTNTIFIDNANLNDNKVYYIATHELLHLLGFNDVYDNGEHKNTDVFYNNTFMKHTNYEDHILGCTIKTDADKMILPNDFACIVAKYSPKAASSIEYDSLLKKSKNLKNAYEVKFYSLNLKNEIRDANEIENDIKFATTTNIKDSNGAITTLTNTFTIENNSFTLTIKDNHKTIETYSGDIVKSDKFIIFKNLKLGALSNMAFKFKNADTVITDLIIIQQDNMIEIMETFGTPIDKTFSFEIINENTLNS